MMGMLLRKYGEKGLPPNSINIRMRGSGGQSFCAFLAAGVSVELEGDANDYVAKVQIITPFICIQLESHSGPMKVFV